MKWTAAKGTLVFACIALVGACTSSADSGGGESGPTAAITEKKCPPIEQSAIDPSATFTWTYTVANSSFDPDKITTSNSQMYLYPVYDSLTYANADGSIEPMLAKDWKVSEDGKTVTLELIGDWQYHDGTPFDAASVKANLDRHRSDGTFNEEQLQSVESVQVVDSDTVKIVTSTGASPLLAILSGSAGMMMSPKVFDDPSQQTMPTGGSGAFRVTEYQPASRVEYTAVDDYWNADAIHVDKIEFLISSDDNARLNAVATGQSDATFLRASMYEAAKESDAVVCQSPSQQAYMIALNVDKEPFDIPEVRRAVNLAIDRDAISALQNGFMRPGIQLMSADYWAASPELTADKYERDLDKARELLADAGLADGFSFTLETNNLASYQQVAQLIQANLADVGIEVEIVPLELPKMTANFSVNKTSSAVLIQEKAPVDPSVQIGSFLLEGGFNNPGNYSNPTVEKLASKAMSASSRDERGKVYAKLFETVYEDAAGPIVLGHMTTPMILGQNVMGFKSWFDGQRKFRGVAIRK